MKGKHVLIVVSIVLVIAIAAASIVLWRKSTAGKDGLLFLQELTSTMSEEEKIIAHELTSNVWIGYRIEMEGLQCQSDEKFGSKLKLIFEADGTCSLELRGEIISAKWRLEGSNITIKGGAIDTKAFYMKERPDGDITESYFTILDIERYSVVFKSEDHLNAAPAQLEEIRKEKEQELAEWIDALGVDVSTCTPKFAELLAMYDFDEFQPVTIYEEDKEALINKYFTPILMLGLQYTSWSWPHELDANTLLRAYEMNVFNAQFSNEESIERDGELVIVPAEEVEAYLSARTNILAEMLSEGEQYSYDPHGYEMRIMNGLGGYFESDIAEMWQHKGYTVIHMLYGSGDKIENHAWFILEENPYVDCYTYLGGSAYKPESW